MLLGYLSVLLWGCTHEAPPLEPTPPPPEDLSYWRVPALVQPAKPVTPVPQLVEHKPTPAEKVYDYVPGGTYAAPVAVGFPLDVILERGETVRNIVGGDPEPLEQGQQAVRWEVKKGASGKDGTMQEHVFIRATEPGLEMGVVLATTRRTYYLTAKSVKASPVRAVRWKYTDVVPEVAPEKEPSLLPNPDEPRKYHVGYAVNSSQPTPAFVPRHIVDDGEKLFLVYSEITLFKTVPLVRAIGPQGPQILNSRQFLNVVIIDSLPSRLELRVGVDLKDQHAEMVTITQGALRTIDCPGDPDCPVWPAAAQQLARR